MGKIEKTLLIAFFAMTSIALQAQTAKIKQVFNNDSVKSLFYDLYDSTLNGWDFSYQSRYVNTHYGRTHVISAGNDSLPVIVLLHGFSGTSLIWYKTIKELHKNYRIYAIDIIGDANRSEMTILMKKSEDWVAWLKEVCDSLNISNATFVGHSYGGFQSMLFTIAYPQIVSKCILITPYPGLFKPKLKLNLKFISLMISPSKEKAEKFLSYCVAKDFIIDKYYSEIILTAFLNSIPIIPSNNYKLSNKSLNSISRPVLLAVGDQQDLYYSYAKAAKRAKANIPNCQTVLIENCGHSPVIEKPELINELIDKFINK